MEVWGLRRNGHSSEAGTPIPRRDLERETIKPAPMVTYHLSPEELERYRAMPRPGKRQKNLSGTFAQGDLAEAKHLHKTTQMSVKEIVTETGANENTVRRLSAEIRKSSTPVQEKTQTAKEPIEMTLTLTRDEYLAERKSGKSRGQIAKEQNVTAGHLVSLLSKWGLRDTVVEERELTKLEVKTATEQAAPTSDQPVHTESTGNPQPYTQETVDNVAKPLAREVTVTVTIEEKIMQAAFEAMIDDVHQTAVSKGWYHKEVSLPVQLALIHSEVSEALEADRKEHGADKVAEELADVVIRAMDTAAAHKLDLAGALFRKMEANKTREYRHGNRKY